MVEQRFFYSAEQCESRMNALKSAYKNYVDEHEQSGSVGPLVAIPDEPTRELMARVAELMKDSVTIQPKVTFAAGSKYLERYGSEVR